MRCVQSLRNVTLTNLLFVSHSPSISLEVFCSIPFTIQFCILVYWFKFIIIIHTHKFAYILFFSTLLAIIWCYFFLIFLIYQFISPALSEASSTCNYYRCFIFRFIKRRIHSIITVFKVFIEIKTPNLNGIVLNIHAQYNNGCSCSIRFIMQMRQHRILNSESPEVWQCRLERTITYSICFA